MQKTNLNLAPYFDDFDKSKNYQKILFKPGLPVQARELTQLQSQLQNQIEEFGNHTFKDGSVVIPGQVGYDLEYHAVMIQNLVNGVEVESYRTSLVGTTITGQNSGVEAIVVNTLSVAESEKNTLTLYVKYTKSGLNTSGTQKTRFDNNETLLSGTTPVAITTLQNASTYTGSIAYITTGVYYIRGYFVQVDDQFVLLDQYSNKPSYKIGLTVKEEIVTSDEDSSLFDNANGSTNFAAPGADRLKISTTLSKDITTFSDNGNFIELLRLKNGELEEIVENSIYNELEKNLARRTYDESGDYTINDFTVKIHETLDNGENNGIYPINSVIEDGRTVLNRTPLSTDPEGSINGNDYYTLEVSPGKAYVRGYEINNVAKKYVTVQKPRTFSEINNKAANINFGQYLTFNTVVGSVTQNELLSLRNSSNLNIGKARAVAISGSDLYITDLTTYTTITIPGTTTGFLEGDFLFSTRGSRGVVESATVSGTNTVVVLRQVTGKFLQNDVVSNSRDSLTYTISVATDYNISQINNIINGSGFTVTFNTAPVLKSVNKNYFVSASNLPVESASDFSYVKLDKTTKTVSNDEVSISVPNNFTVLSTGYTILSSSGSHTATAVINGNTLTLSNISPTVTGSVDIYYKLRINNTSTREKENKRFTFLSVPNKKGTSFTVYGNRFDDSEINLKFPDVYKVHRVHEALVSGVSDNDMFDRISINDINGIVVGDILQLNEVKAKIASISGTVLHVIYLSNNKFAEGSNLTTQVTVITNPTLTGRFLTEVVHGKYKNITDNFALIKNDTEDSYKISKLVRLGNRPTPQNKVIVLFDYLEHSQVNNDFFSVDSINLTEIDYKNIPYTYDGVSYADIFDFRQTYTASQSTGTGAVTSPYVCSNPLSVFDIYSKTKSTSPFPYPSEYISYDYNYYTGRIDRLYLDKNGDFRISTGSTSVSPTLPIDISNALLLSTLTIPAYLKDVKTVKIKSEKTKRYTMKDIGGLESRIDNIEYYTTLSLLETDTNNLSILDSNGNDRFKNGFLVDNFRSSNFAATNNIDYKVSVDTDRGLIRPYPYINNIGLDYDITISGSNENIGQLRKKGDFLLLPYEEVNYASNPYSSRVVNLNPFNTITWVGDFQISPSRDVWYDTQRNIPDDVPVIDLTGPIKFLYDQSGADGDQWGSWTNTGSARTGGGTNIFQERNGVNNEFSSVTQNIDVGDRINSLESITFARSIVIDCFSSRMKPNTELYLFIDGNDSNGVVYPKLFRNVTRTVNSTSFVVGETVRIESFDSTTRSSRRLIAELVSPSVYDSTLSASYSSASTVIAVDNVRVEDETLLNPSNLGSKIKFTGLTTGAIAEVEITVPRISSDAQGNVDAFILLPQDTVETGQSRFVLTDQISNTTISGISDTNAVASYDSEGTLLDITSLSLDFNLPVITTTPISETRTVFIPDPPPPPPRRGDPLAQSFYVDQPGGMFISSIDVYFQSKDDTVPVTIDIRTIENGQPTENILPYSTKTLKASEVSTSANATSVTTFTFDTPVYVAEGNDYAFILRTRSLNYKIWVSRLNETDVTTNQVIDKQPYLGSLYKSQNMSIWTADQFEDIKFNINRAEFITGVAYTANLRNSRISTVNIPSDSLYMTSNSTTITVLQPNHCMHTIQNYVDISGVISDVPDVKLVTNIGNTQFTVDTVITLSDGTFIPTKINNTTVSDTNYGYLLIDDEIFAYKSVSGNTVTVPSGGRGLSNTTLVSHNTNSVVKVYSLNGVPLTQINKRHKLTNIVDMDRYEITTQSKSNETIQTGGSSIFASRNFQYESITPKLNNIVFSGTSLNYKLNTVSGSSVSQKNTGTFVRSNNIPISNLEINELDSSKVVLSEANQTNYFGSSPSFEISVEMSTNNSSVSPVISLSGSSIITAMNRINAVRDINNDIDINKSKDLEPSGSLHDAVYVTKKVNLETSATSVKVLFDAVRRQGVDLKVFVKYKRDDEIDDFNLVEYTEIPSVNYPLSPLDGEVFRAFEYEIGGLESFKEFAIKIVMIGDDQSNVPLIKNLRAIALAV